jgi:hypothetical protein
MGYNAIFEGKRAVLATGLWQEQKDITFLAASGTLPTDAINENSSSKPGIGTDTDLTIGPLHPKPIKYHLTSVT